MSTHAKSGKSGSKKPAQDTPAEPISPDSVRVYDDSYKEGNILADLATTVHDNIPKPEPKLKYILDPIPQSMRNS